MTGNPSVVLIDDEQHSRKFVKLLMEKIDFRVIGEADNGKTGLSMVESLKPDVVILDINMPNVSGAEVLAHIKKRHPETVVIMLTSRNTLEMVKYCISQGADNYLLKENTQSDLCDMVRRTWQKHMTHCQD